MTRPLLTIGMPVFQSEKYIAETLRSLQSQTFGNYELIICDNASTDATGSICAEYARADARIKYVRHKKNIGAPRNWNFAAKQATAPLFKWASSNDLYAPEFLERCVNVLEARQEVVLCYSDTVLIDDDGRQTGTYDDPVNLIPAQWDPKLGIHVT